MKTAKKVIIIVALVFVGAGAALVGISALAFGFGYRNLSIESVSTENEINVIEDSFDSIDIDAVDYDLEIISSGSDKCTVEIDRKNRDSFTVEVKNGTLRVHENEKIKFFYFGFLEKTPKITVSIPNKDYKTLRAVTVSGDIKQNSCGKFEKTDIRTTSGEIYLTGTETEELEIKSVSGDIDVYDTNVLSAEVKTTSGEMDFERFIALDKFSAESVSGGVEFESFDAGEISIKTVSGDVDGSLLSPKKFETNTVSGEIDVPFSENSTQKCSVKTTSGDIEIEIEPRFTR